jgi:hypothetical protein
VPGDRFRPRLGTQLRRRTGCGELIAHDHERLGVVDALLARSSRTLVAPAGHASLEPLTEDCRRALERTSAELV